MFLNNPFHIIIELAGSCFELQSTPGIVNVLWILNSWWSVPLWDMSCIWFELWDISVVKPCVCHQKQEVTVDFCQKRSSRSLLWCTSWLVKHLETSPWLSFCLCICSCPDLLTKGFFLQTWHIVCQWMKLTRKRIYLKREP